MPISPAIAVPDLIFKHFGVVPIRKAEEITADPLTLAGFLEWEGQSQQELDDATRGRIERAVEDMERAVQEVDQDQPISDYILALLAALGLIVAGLSRDVTNISQPITQNRMAGISQASLTSWAGAGIGTDRNLIPSELDVINAMAGQHGFYVSRFFGSRTQNQIQQWVLRAVGARGENAALIADDLLAAFPSLVTRGRAYWGPYVVAALNRGRSYASLRSFNQAGVRDLVYYNPLDERTTTFCRAIAGRVVSVRAALDHMELVAQATTISEIENLAPFVQDGPVDGQFQITTNGTVTVFTAADLTPDFLERNGIMAPPFHHWCRTQILPR